MNKLVRNFFSNSNDILYFVLKPLEHIRGNWDVFWDDDNEAYIVEEDSFSSELNSLIDEISQCEAPVNYHIHEDAIASFLASTWGSITKKGRFWEGAEYRIILEQGSFDDHQQKELILSASGRVQAAIEREQYHIDDMECNHKYMLCTILSIILYHRFNNN